MKGEPKYSAKSDAKQMPKHLPDVVILRITPSPLQKIICKQNNNKKRHE